MTKLELKTASGLSKIHVSESMENLDKYVDPSNTLLLVDENVMRFHAKRIEKFSVVTIPSGEKSKSLEHYSEIFEKLLEKGVDRSWKIVGIGGGVTTDFSGFVASTYFRGLPFGFVSTTLLGQVDASIGGKNGINYKGYKNLIGVIRQPKFVICDIESLKTLPLNQFQDGFAEIIKYGFIKNPEINSYLNDNINLALDYDSVVIEKLVYDSIKVKLDIVHADETEQGDRKLLNFGHTFAHAIEKLYSFSHGQAVSLGMIMAARMSVKLGLLDSKVVDKLVDLLRKTALPTEAGLDANQMSEIMKKDKKKAGDRMQFILLKDEGQAIIEDIKLSDLKNILYDLC